MTGLYQLVEKLGKPKPTQSWSLQENKFASRPRVAKIESVSCERPTVGRWMAVETNAT